MTSLKLAIALLAVGGGLSAAMAEDVTCHDMTSADAAALFQRWNDSLQTGDPAKVVANYADNAVLLPTLSNVPRHDDAEKAAYFTEFLKKDPVGTITESNLIAGCNMAVDDGLYTFTVNDAQGGRTDVQARYTFVYEWVDGQWLIAHHHSSLLPEAPKT
jgi:uncharacterized protein (TIGR02246 family)